MASRTSQRIAESRETTQKEFADNLLDHRSGASNSFDLEEVHRAHKAEVQIEGDLSAPLAERESPKELTQRRLSSSKDFQRSQVERRSQSTNPEDYGHILSSGGSFADLNPQQREKFIEQAKQVGYFDPTDPEKNLWANADGRTTWWLGNSNPTTPGWTKVTHVMKSLPESVVRQIENPFRVQPVQNEIPRTEPEPDNLFRRLGDSVRELFTGIGVGIKTFAQGVKEGMEKVATGIGQIFGGDLKGGLSTVANGVADAVIKAPLNAGASVFAGAVGGGIRLLGIGPPQRPLTQRELKIAHSVFGDSVDFSQVRVQEVPPWVLGITAGGFQAGALTYLNTILAPEGVPMIDRVLIHELVHVAQVRHGGMHAVDALSETIEKLQTSGDGTDVYNLADIPVGATWDELRVEQQARLIDLAFEAGYFKEPGTVLMAQNGEIEHYRRLDQESRADMLNNGYRDLTPLLEQAPFV